MSNFAKAQLLKYGWTEGKGLGKNENGIAEALKPKLKFDTSGVGHKDSEFHWWDSVYDKALKNIGVEKIDDEVSINITNKNAFNISSKKSGLDVSKNQNPLHYGKFLKTSTLQDGSFVKDSTCAVIEDEEKDGDPITFKISDEELFNACGGRTAHKGARHGLKLSGKLARIAEQEKQLLASNYLKSNNENVQTDKVKRKKTKKKKKCMEVEDCTTITNDEDIVGSDDDCSMLHMPTPKEVDEKPSKKSRKKIKRKVNDLSHQLEKAFSIRESEITNSYEEIPGENLEKKSKKKKKYKRKLDDKTEIDNGTSVTDIPFVPTPKKSRKSDVILSDSSSTISSINEKFYQDLDTDNLNSVRYKTKSLNDTDHHSSKDYKFTEADRLNAKIIKKKMKKSEKKQKRKFDQLSESLSAFDLNEEKKLTDNTEHESSKKKHKKKKK